ncbi:MAG: tRNA-dihydrouridine synthase family protein [Clostridia bacterium]
MLKEKNLDFCVGSDLLFAPLAGFSDSGARRLSLKYGAGFAFTEMVSAKGLLYGNDNTGSLLYLDKEEVGKVGVQLFGREPDIFAEVVRYPCLSQFSVIDVNMGCPVPKIVKNGEGSFLMTNPNLAKDIVKSIKKSVPNKYVGVKIRLGFDKNNINASEVALACQEGGADYVTVHGRTRDMMYSGDVDINEIAKVAMAVDIPVVGNGDVIDRDSYLKMKEYGGVGYVMIGRGAIGKPYIFSEILQNHYTFDIKSVIIKHINYLNFLPERVVASNMKKQIAFYLKGVKGQKNMKEKVFATSSLEELLMVVNTLSI